MLSEVNEAPALVGSQLSEEGSQHDCPHETHASRCPVRTQGQAQLARYGSPMETRTSDVGSVLRAARISAGLTLKQIADVCGVGVSAVSKWERGAVPVPVNQLPSLSKAIGVELRVAARSQTDDASRLADMARELSPEQLAAVIALVESLVKKK
jgi:transcriptional regulator with XRE-family HTH domain